VSDRHVFDDIQALGNITIAERLDVIDKSPGGIIIPEISQKSAPWWRVLSVGPKQTEVKTGDRVIFTAGSRIEFEGRTIVALRPEELLGKLPAPVTETSRYRPTTSFRTLRVSTPDCTNSGERDRGQAPHHPQAIIE
jgi:co-chaperonin GroES (HSP10)